MRGILAVMGQGPLFGFDAERGLSQVCTLSRRDVVTTGRRMTAAHFAIHCSAHYAHDMNVITALRIADRIGVE